jgi:hypothetical protein
MSNEILDEIRRIREEHARECNYDVARAFEDYRRETEELRKDGWNIVELPPNKPLKKK